MKLAAATLGLGIAAAIVLPAAGQRITAPPGAGAQIPGEQFPTLAAMLAIEDARTPSAADLTFLIDLAHGSRRADPGVSLYMRRQALGTIGRLERMEMVPVLMAALQDAELRSAAEYGLMLTLRANAPAEGQDEEIAHAVDALINMASPGVLGQLPYSRSDQFEAVDRRLRAALERQDDGRFGAARGLEALARRNRRLGTLADETVATLKKAAQWSLPGMSRPRDQVIVAACVAALIAAGVMDRPLIAAALSEDAFEIRRLGALALYATGANLEADERLDLITAALKDRRGVVRYDALRAWVRHEAAANGCDPVVSALADTDMHVALLAIDSLADRCKGGDAGEAITIRLIGEMGVPPAIGSWHRQAHALVAMAKRDPERAKLSLPGFSQHVTWQVRMYAARAAAILNDTATLESLAADVDDNVRDAALPGLRRLKPEGSDTAIIAALGSRNYELVRTAALQLKGAVKDKATLAAVISALQRITAEKKDTSRDIRLALLERVRELGGADDGPTLERLLTDFDPVIAQETAATILALTGRNAVPAPILLPRSNVPTQKEFMDTSMARVSLDNGRSFDISLNRGAAPLAVTRFVRLIRRRYYDGLTFHRVVPNFVVQGGSPGANEYDGDGQFMRDELVAPHVRGTVGISTRGRHTGDAQVFINLVDNSRLDYDYTVFGSISPRGMEVVDEIQEGTKISRIVLTAPSLSSR